jgi:branched-chain amino acid transport system ATP-binding protein
MPIKIEGLVVGYDQSSVLQGVSMEIPDRCITSILGANGAGKTTLLRSISGLLRARRGSILINGARIQDLPPMKIVKLGIAHVPEGRQLFPDLTIDENLTLGAYAAGTTKQERRQRELVYSYFPRVAERRNQAAGTLSGGEQQMVAIGRALMALPKVLLLDEPSMGLAPKLVQQVFAIIRKLKEQEGLTILLVEQNARLALGLADKVYVLETGRVAAEGTPETLQSDAIVKAFYLGRTDAPEPEGLI